MSVSEQKDMGFTGVLEEDYRPYVRREENTHIHSQSHKEAQTHIGTNKKEQVNIILEILWST